MKIIGLRNTEKELSVNIDLLIEVTILVYIKTLI
jgi:hypothetical protein